jgi:flavin reductase (DIM6/NTAB) family NADH-FMN oxidoreductase RutF
MSQQDTVSNFLRAVRHIPCGLFVITSAFEGTRSGAMTRWVQPCATNPPLIMVAMPNGLPVEPLIRDSRSFALCQIGLDDRLLQRRFARPPARGEDPFLTIPTHKAVTGSPIVDRALCYVDCEISRLVDLEADHRVYVGQILAARELNGDGRPAIELDGLILNGSVNGDTRRAHPDRG